MVYAKAMRRWWPLYLTFALIIILVLATLIALPRIRRSFDEADVIPMVKNYLSQQQEGSKGSQAMAEVAFPLPSSTYRLYSLPIEGRLPYHETIERLLEGPPYAALKDGAVTYIPPKTTLLGLTVRGKIAFVDLSKEFLIPTAWEEGYTLRREQIERSLAPLQIERVNILVESKLLD